MPPHSPPRMTPELLLLEILDYGFALWLGLYLLSRAAGSRSMRLAGTGLAAYGAGLAADLLSHYASDPGLAGNLEQLRGVLLLLPVFCWAGAFAVLLGERKLSHSRQTSALLLTATVFFGLGIVALAFPLALFPYEWVLVAIGIDLLVLGTITAALGALSQGEALLPDILQSLDYSFLEALIFGGQVALVMRLSTGVTFPMLALLLGTIASALAAQTFSSQLQPLFDRLILARFPQMRRQKAELLAAESALPRLNPALDFTALDDETFTRMTRRALSDLGDLPRLAASPLTLLPMIEARLAARGVEANTLARTAELKAVLAESVARLKPPAKGDFGTSDEWRHYNALYFPYIVGLKPYNHRLNHQEDDPAVREALAWFQSQVPERTLHNWQTAAARLVTQDLRERSQLAAVGSDFRSAGSG
jgi:hypothetical protein